MRFFIPNPLARFKSAKTRPHAAAPDGMQGTANAQTSPAKAATPLTALTESETVAAPEYPAPEYPPPDPALMQFLLDIYQGHGFSASREEDWVNVDNGRLLTRAAYFNQSQHGNVNVLQVDFVTVTSAGQHIIESFAGFGEDSSSALRDACHSFVDSTFHAILSALLGEPCEQAETMTWQIGGIMRNITCGALRVRGKFPSEAWPHLFEALQAEMARSQVETGLHWVRYFYSHIPGSTPVVEVLLDNEPWLAMQAILAGLPWPERDAFYSVRLFAFIDDVNRPDTASQHG